MGEGISLTLEVPWRVWIISGVGVSGQCLPNIGSTFFIVVFSSMILFEGVSEEKEFGVSVIISELITLTFEGNKLPTLSRDQK